MYVRRLEIENLRAFQSASIDLLYPGRRKDEPFEDVGRWPPRLPNVNVFLGINGSGKSTLLDAVALALMSPIVSSSGYRPQALVRRPGKGRIPMAYVGAHLVLHPQDGALPGEHRVGASVQKRGDLEFLGTVEPPPSEDIFDDSSPAFFFVGYGASRRTEALSASDMATRRKSRALRYERVASLFEDHFALTPLSAWLPEWRSENKGRYSQVVTLLKKLMPPSVVFTGETESGEYLFRHKGINVPFTSLSDGYRTYIGWVGDLLYHLCMSAPSGFRLIESRGVVMVDEIDLHIHPGWQRTVIPTLARTLKNIQFLFTTHSPLVVSTLERANIYAVHRDRGSPKIYRPDEETLGLSADQLLRSELFGLDSSRDPEFAARLHKLSKAAEQGQEGAALAFLRGASAGAVDETPEPEDAPDWMKTYADESRS